MVLKSYLKYEKEGTFGIVSSGVAIFDTTSELAITCALESVNIWHIRKGNLTNTLIENTSSVANEIEATSLAINSHNKSILAAGYFDGSIKLWDLATNACKVTFRGHDRSITALAFNKNGSLLASGSKDTVLIVWDVLGESGICKLKGHKDLISDCKFLEEKDGFKSKFVVSSSIDSLIKIWNIETMDCVQTLIGSINECWTFDIDPAQNRLICGSVDNQIRVWSLKTDEFDKIEDENSLSKLLLLKEEQEENKKRKMICF